MVCPKAIKRCCCYRKFHKVKSFNHQKEHFLNSISMYVCRCFKISVLVGKYTHTINSKNKKSVNVNENFLINV